MNTRKLLPILAMTAMLLTPPSALARCVVISGDLDLSVPKDLAMEGLAAIFGPAIYGVFLLLPALLVFLVLLDRARTRRKTSKNADIQRPGVQRVSSEIQRKKMDDSGGSETAECHLVGWTRWCLA